METWDMTQIIYISINMKVLSDVSEYLQFYKICCMAALTILLQVGCDFD